jgi:hypothetical protein
VIAYQVHILANSMPDSGEIMRQKRAIFSAKSGLQVRTTANYAEDVSRYLQSRKSKLDRKTCKVREKNEKA